MQKCVNTFLCLFLLGMSKLLSSTVFEGLKYHGSQVIFGVLTPSTPSCKGPRPCVSSLLDSEKICALVMETGPWPLRPVTVQHFSSFSASLSYGVLRISCVYLETQICYETICYKVFGISVKMLWCANPLYFKK